MELVPTSTTASASFPEIREAVRKLCARFPGDYWRSRDRDRIYPTEFVSALTEEGYLSILIPEAYGGLGLGLEAATVVLEEIHRSGCNGAACHAQMYTMGTILRHGSEEQKRRYLPPIASGELRLQGVRGDRAYQRHRHDTHPDFRANRRRSICRERAEDLDLAR